VHLLLQEAERVELEHVSNHIAAEQDSLEAAAAALLKQQQQHSAMAADLAARESAVEVRAATLQSQQGALQAAQASALKQLESLEASLKNKLEAHQKQVGSWHALQDGASMPWQPVPSQAGYSIDQRTECNAAQAITSALELFCKQSELLFSNLAHLMPAGV
jgi:hypothetical protein